MSESEMMQTGIVGMARPPEVVLAEATEAAQALQRVLKGKKDPVTFNGQQYIEFEDWQVLGRFYGLSVKVVTTTPLDFGGVRGFEARAVVLDIRTGVEVSAAEAMCLNDEDKWSARTKYEWHYVKKSGGTSAEDPGRDELIWEEKNGKRLPKKQRVEVGTVPVPMFQLRSMAQTRACAKALRNVLAWVVVLAGYKPQVAEEMTGDEEPEERKAPVKMPTRASEAPKQEANEPPAEGAQGPEVRKITEPQRKRFYAIWKGAGKDEAVVKAYLADMIGTEDDREIPAAFYDEACRWAGAK